MENHNYFYHSQPRPSQLPQIRPYLRHHIIIQQQQTHPQFRPQIPQQQGTIHHRSQLHLQRVHVQSQPQPTYIYNPTTTTVPNPVPTQQLQFVNTNSTITNPPTTPKPLDLTGKGNETPQASHSQGFSSQLQVIPPPPPPPPPQNQSRYETNNQNLLISCNDLAQQNLRLDQQLKVSLEDVKILRDQLDHYVSRLSYYEQQLREATEELKKYKGKGAVIISSEKFNNLVKKSKDFAVSNKELRKEIEKVKGELKKVNDLQSELDKFSKQNELFVKDIVNLNKQVKSEKTSHSKVQEEWVDFKLRNTEEKKELEKKIEEYKLLVKSLQNDQICSQTSHQLEIEKLQKQLNEKEIQINSLTSQLESSCVETNELINKNNNLLNKINGWEGEKKSVENKVNNLECKVQELNEKLSVAEIEKVKVEKKAEGLDRDLNDYIKSVKFYEVKNDELSKKEDKLEEKIKNLQAALESAESENLKLAQSAAHFEGVSKQLGKGLEFLKSLENENKCLTDKVNNLESEKQQQLEELENLDGENEKLNEKLDGLKSDNKNLSKNVKKLKLVASQQEKEIQILTENLENEVSKLKEQLNETTNESEEFEKLQRELDHLKKTFSTERKQLEQDLKKANDREKEAKKILLENTAEISKLKKELSEESSKCKRKSEYIASIKKITADQEAESKKVRPLMTQVRSLKLDKEHLDRQLGAKLEDIKKLNSTIDSLNGKVNELTKSNEEFGQQVIELKVTIQNLENKEGGNFSQRQKQDEEIEKLKLLLNAQLPTIRAGKGRIRELENEIEEKAIKIRKLEENFSIATKRVSSYTNKFKVSEAANAELQKKLETEKDEKKQVEEKVQQQKLKIDELSIKVDIKRAKVYELSQSLNKKTRDLKEHMDSLNENKYKAGKKHDQSTQTSNDIHQIIVRNQIEHEKFKPSTINKDSNMNCINVIHPLEEVSEDEMPELSIPIEKMRKDMANTDGGDENFQSACKRIKWDGDLKNSNELDKIEAGKNVKVSSSLENMELLLQDVEEGEVLENIDETEATDTENLNKLDVHTVV